MACPSIPCGINREIHIFYLNETKMFLLFFATFVTFCNVSAFLIAISSCDQQSIFFGVGGIKSSPLSLILQIDA
jgi:hypothetical protein